MDGPIADLGNSEATKLWGVLTTVTHPTMVKGSSAWGALAGVSAADLAEDGFTEAPALTCENPVLADIWGDLGETWRILEINFKVFPVCRWSRLVIEAIRSLRAKHGITGKDVASIHVASFREAMRLDTRRPADSDAAQYPLPLAAALSLLEDNLTPETLHPSVYDRSEVWRLVDAVKVSSKESYDAIFPTERRCDVTLKLNNGQSVTLEGAEARGNFDDPLSDGDLLAKFETYASTCLQGDQRGQIAFILSDPSRAPTVQGLLNLIGKQ